MSLFQKSVEKKFLNGLDSVLVDKKYKEFQDYFGNPEIQENIRNLKEEAFQEGFLRESFVKILGFTLNPQPNYNLVLEKKNVDDAKKADGAILKDGDVLAVIELKSTNTTDLDSVEGQVFGYKNHHPKCVYAITSNFEKLRFYIQNAVDYIDFDLFNMTQEQFSLLWLCLSKDNLLSGLPLQVKDSSLLHEENITKKLYADYSKFREILYANLIKNNPEKDKLLLFKKTQKLLDRFLFIFFAEDRLLISPNYTSDIVREWRTLKDEFDEYRPLYERFKKHFSYLNSGHKDAKHDIFAYNGGLFAPDEVLDNISIDDEVLEEHTLLLSQYDFETDVDVNILGHIFEHSLGEIENVQAEIKGEKVDSQRSKRKKDGIFYTPKYITKYIVENTLGRICDEKKNELGIVDEEYARGRKYRRGETIKKLDKKLETYRNWLLSLTILDPACGSGAFLNQALEFLIEEHHKIDELRWQLFGGSIVFPDITNEILEKNIYGVDLNEESVEIAKLSLWLRTAQKGRKLNKLNNNIKCGNSLIDDPNVAGDKAFKWDEEFPEIFAKGGFDVVIGNPPYVFAREKISDIEKNFYTQNFDSADYQVNTYLLFIEKSIKVIKRNAIFGLIVPNAWLMVYSGKGLRKYLLERCKLSQVINLEGYSFEGVNVETIIVISKKETTQNNNFDILISNDKEFVFSHKRNQNDFYNNEGFAFRVFSDDVSVALTRKLLKGSVNLDSIVQIKAGLKAYEKGKGTPAQSAEDVKKRPYDYNYKFDESTYKYLEGKDVGRYFMKWSGSYLKYGEHLAAPRTFDIFSDEKIIIREITGNYPKSINALYSEDVFLFNMSNIAVIKREGKQISLKYILAVLNSTLISYYFLKNTAKSVRKMFPKVILKDLRLFPFKEINPSGQQPFIDKVDLIQSEIIKFHEIKNEFKRFLETKFNLESISKKLQSWDELNSKDFLNELKKSKIKLSLSEQAEWMEYFNEQKEKALTLKSEIESIDKEIDQLVYQLYGLTEKEIEIVENGGK